MTAKINKDVTEDAEETDVVAEEAEAEEAAPKPAKKKVRRVRVIEVIDDEDDDADLSDVLDALDEADADDDEEPAKATKTTKPVKAAEVVAEDVDTAEPAPKVKAVKPPGGPTVLGASPIVAGVVIVLIAALATLSIFLWSSQSDLSSKQDTRKELEKRISDYGNAVLSLDRNNLQASIDRMKSFLTGDALDGAKKTDVATLKPNMDKNGVNFTSKTKAVYLGNVGGKFAGATLVFDWTIQSATGPQTVTGNHVKLDLVKQGGKWMISKQTPAGQETDGAQGTGVPGLNGQTPKPGTSPSPSTSGKPKQ